MSRARDNANTPVTGVTLTGAQTLTNKTLTTPVIASVSNSGTVTLPTGTRTLVAQDTTDTLTNKTLTAPVLLGPEERCNVVAAAATGTINLDVLTAGVWFYTTNASANHTLNIRGNSGTTLNSLLAVGDSITAVWMFNTGATAYYPAVIQIDGNNITPKWAGGTAPTGGTASAVNALTLTILKTAATPTYTVLAGLSSFS